MNNKELIITRQFLGGKRNYLVSALYENRKMAEADCSPDDETAVLGCIFIAKVQKIVKNINAAFLEYAPGQMGYLPLEKVTAPLFTKKAGKKPLCVGDELVVQVEKDAIKTKDAILTTNFSISGKYAVVSYENRRIGISTKLDRSDRKHFLELFKDFPVSEYGLIVRTNAKEASDEAVLTEVQILLEKMQELTSHAVHKTCFSMLLKASERYLDFLKRFPADGLEKIITDAPDVYEKLSSVLRETDPAALEKLVFYQDPSWSLNNLYQVTGSLENALKRVVWLKSGANLVIEPTEALTVIDVNSGKNVARKGMDENFLKINMEAASAIARELRLRNISGMILVDFINMEQESSKQELIRHLMEELKQDPVKTSFIDITKLGLAEITRMKTRKSLQEQLSFYK